MKNKKYFPCERNNYFFGKLLTVRDFENEQRYNNDKRRLSNKFLNGSGVVSGLDVVLVDDQTISVETGMAIDFSGREIIVDEPVFKKINMIDGFETVKEKKNVYLCIAYEEVMTESVFSLDNNSLNVKESNDFNRIKESYSLYLTDRQPDESKWNLNSLIESKYILFDNEGVRVEQIVPKFVKNGQALDIIVNIEKSNLTSPIDLEYIVKSNIFKANDQDNDLKVSYNEKDYITDKKITLKYSMRADGYKNTEGKLVVPTENFKLSIGDRVFNINTQRVYNVNIIDKPITAAAIEEYYKRNMDDLAETTEEHNIYLAKLNLITSQNIFIVDRIDKMPFKQYVLSNELLSLLWRIDDKNEKTGIEADNLLKKELQEELKLSGADLPGIDNKVSTGVEVIDLGFNPKVNMSFFSNEIAHGLGVGEVFVILSIEENNEQQMQLGKQRIFGNQEVFDKSPYEPISPRITLGAMAYPDKGTIRIGIKLLERTEHQSIYIRWWVYKTPAESKKSVDSILARDVKVFIEPDVLNVAPLEKGYFNAVVSGTADKTVKWSIVESDGGQIDENGIYEAPSKEGVYEVVAESTKYAGKKAMAYVVVKAKE